MKGIIFNGKHSYHDFGLILTSKSIGIPEPKTEMIDVDGMDGEIDLSEVFGEINYKNRKLSFDFEKIGTPSEFLATVESVAIFLHGKVINVVLEDDPEYFYRGRCKINSFLIDKVTCTFKIEMDADPYKYSSLITTMVNPVKVNLSNSYSVIPELIELVVKEKTTSLKVFNTSLGETLILNGDFNIDDTLQISFNPFKVTKNTLNDFSSLDFQESDLDFHIKGENTIQATPNSTNLKLTYRRKLI